MRAPLTRELLVATARAIVERDGVEAVTLRGLARDLGVTAPALYAYVDDKHDLLAAVATEHFEQLVERFEEIDETDPVERIRAQSRAYVAHAVGSPGLFRLMFRFPPRPLPGVTAFPPAEKAYESAAAAISAAIELGELQVEDATVASLAMWAAVHGVAEVLLTGLWGDDEATATMLVETVVDTMLDGMGRRPAGGRRTAG
jgi:AcrR family transcriptional regulator